MLAQNPQRRAFELLLSNDVRPYLKVRGFTKQRRTFQRRRGVLYDMIDFQGNRYNGVTPWHGFFVNVGVGSTEVDATWPDPDPSNRPPMHHLLSRRWESVLPDAPYELRFDDDTDMGEFASELCGLLGRVVDVFDEFDCTATLIRYAVEHNYLIQYERTCCYLAATGDIQTLAGYVQRLRDRFGHQERWSIFNNRISAVTGAHTSTLVELGLLDPH